MRLLPAPVTAHLEAGGAWYVEILIRLGVRNRTTGASEEVRLWTGADHQTIEVEGQERTHYGAGAITDVGLLRQRSGTLVQEWQVDFSPLSPAVETAFRVHNPRFGRVEAWEWHMDPESGLPLAEPERFFRGFIVSAPLTEPAKGGEAVRSVTFVSSAWRLTAGLTLKRSHEALIARSPGDGFRRYNDISGAVETAWGEKSAKAPPGAAPKPSKPPQNFRDESDWGP